MNARGENAEIVKFMRTPDTENRLQSIGAEVLTSTPQEFARVIEADIERWGKLVKRLGLRAN